MATSLKATKYLISLIKTILYKTVTTSTNDVSLNGEVENSEFSENSETSENQFSEVFNSEFSVLYYTENRKVGVENLGDLL